MRAADQWALIEGDLGVEWDEVRLAFTPEGSLAEAAAVLAPLQPVRVENELRFHVERAGAGPQRARNILTRLDRKRIWGTLSLLDVARAPEHEQRARAAATGRSLVERWDETLSELPPDWSDLLCELELDSSDHVPRAALLGAPLNPTRTPGAIALRFRVSRMQGYGASPVMVRRCLERMDAEGITGDLAVVYSLSDTDNEFTQGPVWRVAGRSV